jgi:hypothetical protein
MREQVGMICEDLRDLKQGKRASYQDIAEYLGIPNGRPTVFTSQVIQSIELLIMKRFEAKDPVTIVELIDHIQYMFNITVSDDTMRKFVHRFPGVQTILGLPMDICRVQTSDEEIKHWYDELAPLLTAIPAEFVYNMDEAGCSPWVDSRELMIVVPSTYLEDSMFIPVDRHTKRSSLAACICADGSSMKPFVIIDRLSIDERVVLAGYGPRVVEFVHQKNSYMTSLLFEKWADDIFFPTISQRRRTFGYTGSVLLIMDGFGAHSTDKFLSKCVAQNVTVKFLIPHTSDRCQPCDQTVFSVFKNHYARMRFKDPQSKQTSRIVRIMRSWRKATAEDLVVTSFRNAGIDRCRLATELFTFCKVNLSLSHRLRHLAPTPQITIIKMSRASKPKQRIRIQAEDKDPEE